MKFNDLYKSILLREFDAEAETLGRDENNTQNDVSQSTIKEEPTTTPEPEKKENGLVEQLKQALSKGASFASFLYRAKGTAKGDQEPNGAVGIYNLNLNVDYKRVKAEDRAKIEAYQPTNPVEVQAKEEMLNPRPYANKDVFEQLGKGIRLNVKNGKIHIFGWPQKYELIKAGTPKAEPKGEVPRAKKEITKKLGLKANKIRDFILDPTHVAGLKVKGNTIMFQPDEPEMVAKVDDVANTKGGETTEGEE